MVLTPGFFKRQTLDAKNHFSDMKKTDIIFYLAALVSGGAGAWVMAIYGNKIGFSDNPGERSSHKHVTPKGGGIGILAAFLFFSVVFNIVWTFWVPALIISLVSFWGDRSDIRPVFRLIVQFAAAIMLVSGIWGSDQNPIHAYLLLLCCAIFIVGTANCYNFMDGINGIAGITGLAGFGLLSFYAFRIGANPDYIKLSLCMAFGCLGFLPFNIPNARVFMGDVGSVLLGFVFSGLMVVFCRNWLDFFVMTAFLLPFYADGLTTMAIRFVDGENLSKPHRRHLYQILANEGGMRHWKVSAGYGFIQLFIGISIISLCNKDSPAVILLFVLYFALFAYFSCFIRRKVLHLISWPGFKSDQR
ncbi:MAG: glycosyltransferase family 4 protein [Deltaproteobacteria bacterium]|nr:glycosyltransferase family 4 protein [Deltaproteobacteria bacterium]